MSYVIPDLIQKGDGGAESKSLEIVLIKATDIVSEPARDAGKVTMTGTYVVASDAYWTKLQVTNSKTSLPLTGEGDEDNISISTLPEFSYPGQTLEIEELLANYTGEGIVLGVKIGKCGSGDSYYKMYGSKCAPLTLIPEGTNNNESAMYLLKFQQFTKTKEIPGRYTGTFTFATPTVVPADTTEIDVSNGPGEYQLTENTQVTQITTLENAVAGEVYTLIGSGGSIPASIVDDGTFILNLANGWGGIENATITFTAMMGGSGNMRFIEKTRT
ncbi:hypothetical protein EZY14_002760 [Kordia sp. TARA_039_SRF]|nr:hypothetical protein EZY14_002760 [Kordia sp. TARA_039_SRF]